MSIHSLKKISDFEYHLEKSYQNGMKVPGIIFADEILINMIISDNAYKQVANVATLPGIQKGSFAMPDIHWGYGFPIGGVAAMDVDSGVVSPGGVGYDINCGVRLFTSDLPSEDVSSRLNQLIDNIFKMVPCGVGSSGKIHAKGNDLENLLRNGSKWALDNGMAWNEDIDRTEEKGQMRGADPHEVSSRAKTRGSDQIGTLGSGNHFIEIQKIDEIYEQKTATAFGLHKNQICCMIHTGSRGFGHQVCGDYAKSLVNKMSRYGIDVPDKQLASAPIDSPDGKQYLAAMACAANYAWVNRQVIMHFCREAFEKTFEQKASRLGLHMVYDVAHNIAKFETHEIDGKRKKLLVHRKGATRAFGPESPDLPNNYKNYGQPVIIPGDMGSASYILAGTREAMKKSFGSTCHGAGRKMSRRKAISSMKGRRIDRELLEKGIYAKWRGRDTMKEEAPEAYKDIDHIIQVVEGARISKKVARLVPIGVVKG